jgi:spermidine synthase
LLALAAFSGFATFAAEILLVQALGLVLDQSVYAFGAVLCVVLAALAAGAGAAALASRRGIAPATLLAVGGVLAAVAFASFPARFVDATGGLAFLAPGRPWPGYLADALAITARTAGPALVAAGLVLPATFAAAGARGGAARVAAPTALGRLAAANTAGSLAGALAAPWALLPGLGLWPAFGALAAGYGALALAAPGATRRARVGAALALAVGAAAVLALASPAGVPPLRIGPGERLVEVQPTAAGVVAVVEREGELLIQVDNHYSLGGTGQRVHEERQGHLPLLLHPAARSVAWIGAATGISAGATLAHPIERLVLVELVPGVAHAARRRFAASNRGVYEDPRSEVVLDDGRNFLRSTAERFDVVVADLFVPWQAGAASLYTRDHFASVRARLAEGGLFCQWLPLYQLGEPEVRTILSGFLDAFPRAALFRGDFYGRFPIAALVGFAGEAPSADAVSNAALRLASAGERDRWVAHPLGPFALYVGPLGPLAPSLAGVPRHTDRWPRLEFEVARRRADGSLAREPFTGLRFAAFARAVARSEEAQPLFGALGDARRRAVAGGHALQTADALHDAGRTDESGAALAAAASLLPRELLADATEDPTAVGVWPAAGAGAAPALPPGG